MDYVYTTLIYAATVVLPFWLIWKGYDFLIGFGLRLYEARRLNKSELTFIVCEADSDEEVEEDCHKKTSELSTRNYRRV